MPIVGPEAWSEAVHSVCIPLATGSGRPVPGTWRGAKQLQPPSWQRRAHGPPAESLPTAFCRFGEPANHDPGVEPSLPRHHTKRGSSGSLSDSAGNEQAEGAAGGGHQHWRRTPSNRRQAPPAPHSARHQNGAVQEDENGALGTWAGRQRVFADHFRQQQEQQQEQRPHGGEVLRPPDGAAAEHGEPSQVQAGGSSPPAMPAPTAVQQLMQAGETSLDQEMNAAWRCGTGA